MHYPSANDTRSREQDDLTRRPQPERKPQPRPNEWKRQVTKERN